MFSAFFLVGALHFPTFSEGKSSYTGCFDGYYRSSGCGVLKKDKQISQKACIKLVQKEVKSGRNYRYALIWHSWHKKSCMACKKVQRNNARRMPDSTCKRQRGISTFYAVYDLKGLTKTVPIPPKNSQCKRPRGWCATLGGKYYHNVDCNGDGIKDHVCKHGNHQGTIISGTGGCRVKYPNAPTASCPKVFKSPKTGYIGCYDRLYKKRGCSIFPSDNSSEQVCAYAMSRRKRRYAVFWYSRQKRICMGCYSGLQTGNALQDKTCKLTKFAERYSVYDLKGITPPIPSSNACTRPANWCAHGGHRHYYHVDCNGDGRKDHVCWHGKSRGVLLSGNCKDRSNQWPNAPKSACPKVFNKSRTRTKRCKRPSNWCSHAKNKYYHSPDCDGDGVRDHVCWHGKSLGLLLSKNCNSKANRWPNAKKSSCPALKRICSRPANWCAHSNHRHYRFVDCNGDGIKDHVCWHRGNRGVRLSGHCNDAKSKWPNAPKSTCPKVFGK